MSRVRSILKLFFVAQVGVLFFASTSCNSRSKAERESEELVEELVREISPLSIVGSFDLLELDYERQNGEPYFSEVRSKIKGQLEITVAGSTETSSLDEDEAFDDSDGSYSKISLEKTADGIHIREQEKFILGEGNPESVELDDSYEAEADSGSWEDFIAGKKLVLKLSEKGKKDMEESYKELFGGELDALMRHYLLQELGSVVDADFEKALQKIDVNLEGVVGGFDQATYEIEGDRLKFYCTDMQMEMKLHLSFKK